MTSKELVKKISDLPDNLRDMLSKIVLSLNIVTIGKYTETGLVSINEFANNQVNGWNNLENIPFELNVDKNYFKELQNIINDIANNLNTQSTLNNVSFRCEKIKNYTPTQVLYLYDSPETLFLINLSKIYQRSVKSARNFFDSKDNETVSFSTKEGFLGNILAYEFQNKDSIITDKKEKEKKSLASIRTELRKSIEGSKESLVEFLSESKELVKSFSDGIDELKKEKDDTFNEWFVRSKAEFEEWDSYTRIKVDELTDIYEEKLRLKAPVEYWKKRATEMIKRGDQAKYWLIALIVTSCLFLISFFTFSPQGIIQKLFSGDLSALKWTFTSITIISFLAYGVRSLNKLMFSSYHLARDAEEREQLTYLYLALHNDNKVDEKERIIVLQALFSRADTGLLKEDSSPTMPSGIFESFIKK